MTGVRMLRSERAGVKLHQGERCVRCIKNALLMFLGTLAQTQPAFDLTPACWLVKDVVK